MVDDKAEEAAPLLRAFSRKGSPYLYYTGALDTLPEEPLTGVRFVFLDIELAGMSGQSNKNKASMLVGVLRKIVSAGNGPYAVLFWTTHGEVIEQVKENLSGSDLEPVAYVITDKASYLAGNLDALVPHLQTQLSEVGAFQLYVEWENILGKSAREFVTEFSAHVNVRAEWSKETAELFYRLYKAYVGQNELADESEKFKCACHLMNRSFFDALHNATNEHLSVPDGFSLTGGDVLEDEVKAKLNTSLFLSRHNLSRPHTGHVYSVDDDELKGMLVKKIFKGAEQPETAILCKIIVTPECDLAQKKTIDKTDGVRVQQVVCGLLCKMEKASLEEELKRLDSKGRDSKYKIAPIWHDGAICLMHIHFASLTFCPEDDLPETSIFALRRDLVFDLQSKAANHVNRLGNYLLE